MININKVILVGRLTKDIELRKTRNNISVCQFTVAVDKRYSTDQNASKADFIACIAWKQSAEYLNNYARKGTVISVEGRIQTRSYDGQNGKVYVTEVAADAVQIIAQKNDKPVQTTLSQDGRDVTGHMDNFGGYASNSPQDIGIDTNDLDFY